MRQKTLKSLFFILFFFYFLYKKKYKKEIFQNYFHLFKKKQFSFGKYFKALSENLATMFLINENNIFLLFDKIKFFGDNIIRKRGGVVITLHYGIYELLPLIFLKMGYKTAMVYSEQRNPLFNTFLLRLRRRKSLKLLKSLKEIKEALKENYLIGFAIDNIHKGKLLSLKEILPNLKLLSSPFIISQIFSYPLYSILIRRNQRNYEIVIKEGFSPSWIKEEIKKNIFDWVLWGK